MNIIFICLSTCGRPQEWKGQEFLALLLVVCYKRQQQPAEEVDARDLDGWQFKSLD